MKSYIILPLLSSLVLNLAALDIYVSPKGSEAGNGTKSRPVSLERALKLIQISRDEEKVVHLHPGVYMIEETFCLDERANGVQLRAMQAKKSILIGGKYLKASYFKRISDKKIYQRLPEKVRSKVAEVNLAPLKLRRRGDLVDFYAEGNGGTLDLYFKGDRQVIARWPNEGYTTMGEVLANGVYNSKTGGEPGQFIYRDERAKNWVQAAEDGDLFLRGFWRVPWVSQCIRVGAVDPKNMTITHKIGIGGGIGSKYAKTVDGVRKGDGKELYYAFNLPEELDSPGEWYLNSKTQKLYFYPPGKIGDQSLLIADLDAPIIEVKNAKDVSIEGVMIEGGLREALSIQNSEGVKIAGCTIRKTGGTGIVLNGGKDCHILSNDLHNLGGGGMNINGGDRKTLTPSGHRIVNNKIYRFGEVATISLGMTVNGCGNYIAHNEIFEGNYGGITYGGNDHVFEYNELYHLGLDGGDYGFFYANANWGSAGSVVRYNFGHHASNGNFFYPDDGKSYEKAEHNVVYKLSAGLFMGGGHHNQFLGNLVLDCGVGLHMDDRGISRKYDANSSYHMKDYDAFAKDNELFTKKYPGIDRIHLDDPTLPTGNLVEQNTVIRCKEGERFKYDKKSFEKMTVQDNVFQQEEIGFVDEAKLKLTLKDDGILGGRLQWVNEEFAKIGLFVDEYRTKLIDNPARYEFKQVVREFNSATDMEATNKASKGK